MITTLLLQLASPALASDAPPPTSAELLERSRRTNRSGAIALGLGIAGLGGGFALLTVGRPSSQINTEEDGPRELRNAAGIATVMAGATGVLVGIHFFERAATYKRDASVALVPALGLDGAGLTMVARF